MTFNSKGAAIERVELTARNANGKLKYRNLEDKSGYLGNLALTIRREGGCIVNVVGDGTPAALAGLSRGDVLLSVDGVPLNEPRELKQALSAKKPGESVTLLVERPGATPPNGQRICFWNWGARLRLVGLSDGAGFTCPLSQYTLADALGLSAVHVNRVLRELRDAGLMTFQKGKVTFDNYDGLVDFAGFNRNYLDHDGPLLR